VEYDGTNPRIGMASHSCELMTARIARPVPDNYNLTSIRKAFEEVEISKLPQL